MSTTTSDLQNQSQQQKPLLGLVFAMQEEQQGLEHLLEDKKVIVKGKRRYLLGKFQGLDCVCVLSGIGKVAAATTVTCLIEHFSVTRIVLLGVAGAADTGLAIGDIVIATSLLQHDMDASPLFPRFEVPLTSTSHFASDSALTAVLSRAAQVFVDKELRLCISEVDIHRFKLENVKVRQGLIASGDQFINDERVLQGLKADLPDLLAVEMEGAAIAQVCHDYQIPFAILRTISDDASEHADFNFSLFIEKVAAQYSLAILRQFCALKA
jgi:adenosylhomocysteine nucleosidase